MSDSAFVEDILTHLRQRWRLWLVGEIAVLLLVFVGLTASVRFEYAAPRTLQWLLQALAVLLVELLLLRRNLAKNHRPGEEMLLPSLGIGNGLSLVRGFAYACMAGFLFQPRPGNLLDWLPAALYGAAAIADFFDGYLARLTDHATVLGEVLDIEFDGIGMLLAMGLAIYYGQLPAVFLLLALGRPLFVWGIRRREQRGLAVHPMTPSSLRRMVAGMLMGFMAVVLWPVFEPPATWIAGAVFGGAVAASFVRDWLVVSGRLDANSPVYRRWRARFKGLAFDWLPLLVRGLAPLAGGWLLWHFPRDGALWAALPSLLLTALGILAAGSALVGLLPRLAGLVLATLACVDLLVAGQAPDNGLLLLLGALLVVLGGGRGALWTGDEPLFHGQLGRARRSEG